MPGVGGELKTMRGRLALVEVTLFYALALFVIWAGGKHRPTIAIVIAAMLGLCLLSNRIHGDSWERIGFAKKNFWPNLRWSFAVGVPLLIPLVIIAARKEYQGEWNLLFMMLVYPIWGFVQEYALLGFVANRLEDGLPDHKRMIPWNNGFLFAMAHLPNPALICVTFVAGTLFTAIYFKHRHLIPLALVHAAFGIAINLAFGHIRGIMSVGPGYWARVGTPWI